MNIINYLRLILTLVAFYLFFVEYLGKKYYRVFNQSIKEDFNKNDLQEIFNFSQIYFNNEVFEDRKQKIQSHSGQQQQQKQNSSELSIFQFKKKVNTYIFTFYNLHRIEIRLTDLGYDSYLEFSLVQENKGQFNILEKVGFKLPELIDNQALIFKQLLNFKFQSKDFSINISQFTTPQGNNDKFSDGYINQQLLYLSQNKKNITQQDFKRYGSAKTITLFNINLKRADLQLRANLTHVIRHNQCFLNKQTHINKKKCIGGYGNGKINLRNFIKNNYDNIHQKIHGDWTKGTLNLDNSRVRTIFIGEQSNSNYLKNLLPYINSYSLERARFNHRRISIDFVGFDKDQYYSKNDRIQKQKWVGMSICHNFKQNGQFQKKSLLQNYLFVNGNIHLIRQINFQILLRKDYLAVGQTIIFSNKQNNNKKDQITLTPLFNIKFDIFNVTLAKKNNIFDNKQVYKAYGYFSGWINQTSIFQDASLKSNYSTQQYGYVGFYNITGLLQISQQIY